MGRRNRDIDKEELQIKDEIDPSNYVSESLPIILERLDSESADISPDRQHNSSLVSEQKK